MAGALSDSKLSPDTAAHSGFALAGKADDAEIRRLLRENCTPGRISLSFEREPDYFADAGIPGEEKQTIVARENGRLVCMGSCAVRQRFVNGRPRRVGYLGELRLDCAFAGRFDIVRRGYRFFKGIESGNPADFYFTSIAADNERARRFLERGLPGMPRYEFLAELVTLVIPTSTRSGPLPQPVSSRSRVERVARVNQHNCQYQLSPSWSIDEVKHIERLGLDDCLKVDLNGRSIASGSVWDQRVFRQTAIRAYCPSLAFCRPFLNVAAGFFGQPRLPAPGTILANAFVTQLAVDPGYPGASVDLIKVLLHRAARHGVDYLTVAFTDQDARLAAVRSHFQRREYLTRLYLVRWPEFGGSASDLDDRPVAPDIALL